MVLVILILLFTFGIMTGKQLFNKLTVRDFTNSEADEYAQLLLTIEASIGDDILPLLEQADAQGKKLDVKDIDALHEIITSSVFLV